MPLEDKVQQFYNKYNQYYKSENNCLHKEPFDINQFRNVVDQFYTQFLQNIPMPNGIEVEETKLYFDGYEVKAIVYKPCHIKEVLPAIVFHPGGGLAVDMTKFLAYACAEMSKASHAAVICIQPPLTPEDKFPEIFFSAYKATRYFYQNAAKYGLNKEQFVMSGYGMGGTIAALITNRARRDKEIKVASQVIISGVLDIGNTPDNYNDDVMFNRQMHEKFLEMCVPDYLDFSDMKNNPAFSPAADRFFTMPPTCLITGEKDALKEDTLKMAQRLRNSGAKVETIIIPGQMHNSMLLYPLMNDAKHPATIAGEKTLELLAQKCH